MNPSSASLLQPSQDSDSSSMEKGGGVEESERGKRARASDKSPVTSENHQTRDEKREKRSSLVGLDTTATTMRLIYGRGCSFHYLIIVH
jgi:hypothetical protein